MWVKITCITLLALLAVGQCSLLDTLKIVHANPSFNTLNAADQVLIIELIAEVEAGELKAYIDEIGFHHVLAVIDKLPAAEAHAVNTYLVQELNKEENANGTLAVGKRDLTSTLNQVVNNPEFSNLPMADQETIKAMVVAAESRNLTAYIDNVGYSTILTLMDGLPQVEGHMFEMYLFEHLASESGH